MKSQEAAYTVIKQQYFLHWPLNSLSFSPKFPHNESYCHISPTSLLCPAILQLPSSQISSGSSPLIQSALLPLPEASSQHNSLKPFNGYSWPSVESNSIWFSRPWRLSPSSMSLLFPTWTCPKPYYIGWWRLPLCYHALFYLSDCSFCPFRLESPPLLPIVNSYAGLSGLDLNTSFWKPSLQSLRLR